MVLYQYILSNTLEWKTLKKKKVCYLVVWISLV